MPRAALFSDLQVPLEGFCNVRIIEGRNFLMSRTLRFMATGLAVVAAIAVLTGTADAHPFGSLLGKLIGGTSPDSFIDLSPIFG